jgi:hypothetical protein
MVTTNRTKTFEKVGDGDVNTENDGAETVPNMYGR